MSRWHTFLEITTGRGMHTRDRAGRILAVLLGFAIILITFATMIDSLNAPGGLSNAGLTLLLGVLTLLVGTVSGFLARVQDSHGYDTRAAVGTILTGTLGVTMIVISAATLYEAFIQPDSRINANVVSLLTAVIGGGIGATSAYLGIPRATQPEPLPPADPPAAPPSEGA